MRCPIALSAPTIFLALPLLPPSSPRWGEGEARRNFVGRGGAFRFPGLLARLPPHPDPLPGGERELVGFLAIRRT